MRRQSVDVPRDSGWIVRAAGASAAISKNFVKESWEIKVDVEIIHFDSKNARHPHATHILGYP